MVSEVASKVGSVVSEKFTAVTDTLSKWGSSVVDTINPANWFADGKIALQPMHAVFAEAGPEAAIPLDERGLDFLRKTFNLDDNSFNIALNKSDLFNAIMDIQTNVVEIKEIVSGIDYKMSSMEKPSFFESINQSYTNMYSPTPSKSSGGKKENPGELILEKLMEIEKLIKSAPQGGDNSTTQIQDSEMSIAKMIATGILGRR
jgi:hypothetical protein